MEFESPVFVSGTEGYHTFRIPALLAAADGSLLAFAEGRRHGLGDAGDIDLVLRRSTDGGGTWSALQLVGGSGSNTFGNPCPVLDRRSGDILLLATQNLGSDSEAEIIAGTSRGTRSVWLLRSEDHGASWSEPREITASVKPSDWRWYATGPGNGIQLTRGAHVDRLVVPCDHSVPAASRDEGFRSHIIYSDDGGRAWRFGEPTPGRRNECAVIERSDGSLLLNMRSYRGRNCRASALSRDGGLTWERHRDEPELVEPVCQGSMIRASWAEDHGGNAVLFSNPASVRRENLTVRLSRDDGETWTAAKTLWAGPAAYSSLGALTDDSIGCLYERGDRNPYERIVFARFSAAFLEAE